MRQNVMKYLWALGDPANLSTIGEEYVRGEKYCQGQGQMLEPHRQSCNIELTNTVGWEQTRF